ncbi:hypothetical protein YC2023_038964 [Brassica napus]
MWEDFLVGNFLDTAPHVAKIHAVVNKIWREGGKGQAVEVYEVDSTTMKFRVSDPSMRARILRRGMWNIGNIPLVVTKWTPEELKEKPEIQAIPMWVYLKNVPMNMYSWEGLSFITSAVGHPVKIHPETAFCSNFKLAKIFVNANLTKELPKKINFTKNGKSTTVEFIYPRLPVRCLTCNKWGHVEKACVMNKKDEALRSVTEMIKEGYSRENATEELANKEGNSVIRRSEMSTPEKSIVEKEMEVIEEGEVVKGWSDVTPGKARKSPKLLEYGQVKIATRFDALSNVDDNGDLVERIEEVEAVPVGEKMEDETETLGEDNLITPAKNNEQSQNGNNSTTEQEKPDEVVGGKSLRPSLSRVSKTNHKVIPECTAKETENPDTLGKRSRKPSQ